MFEKVIAFLFALLKFFVDLWNRESKWPRHFAPPSFPSQVALVYFSPSLPPEQRLENLFSQDPFYRFWRIWDASRFEPTAFSLSALHVVFSFYIQGLKFLLRFLIRRRVFMCCTGPLD